MTLIYNPIENTLTIPVGDYLVLFFGFILSFFVLALFMFVTLRLGRLLDRYRLKYSFDKDIELKEMDNPKNLDKREQRFKRRTFKD